MEIGYSLYPVVTLGYGKRLGVWFQGCQRRCSGCISPELQPFSGGHSMTPEEILYKIPKEEMPDGLTVSGGEPFAQPEGLLALLEEYRKRYSGDILIFTGYCLEELEQSDSEVIQKILKQTDVLIDEVYIENLNDGKGLRGSSNQRIHIFHEKEKYEDAQNWERKLQCAILDHYLWLIGIPPTEESKENE